ncbi:MAG: hypothetical protein AAGD10_08325 [Myxococcota bacterium]
MSDPFAAIKAHFERVDGVVVNNGRGSQGMKVGAKMFAMFGKVGLVLTLPPARVKALIEEGRALPFDPGTGTPMKDRILLPVESKNDWISLAEEAAAAFARR